MTFGEIDYWTLSLPYHVARKKIPRLILSRGKWNDSRCQIGSVYFDVFEKAESRCSSAFLVLKNSLHLKTRSGALKDSPEYCAELLFALHRKYLEEAGAKIEADGKYELAASITYEGKEWNLSMITSQTIILQLINRGK